MASREERDASIAKQARAGLPQAEIARQNGVSVSTVRNVLREFGLTGAAPGANAPAMEILRRLLERKPVAEIASELGITTQRVYAVKGEAEKAGVFDAAASYRAKRAKG